MGRERRAPRRRPSSDGFEADGVDTGGPRTRRTETGLAELVPDRDHPQAWSLLLDGAPQSHVDLADPTRLAFEYQRRLGHLIDLAAEPGKPIQVLHLGGGALTLARYTAATRPRSRQQVAEIDTGLTEWVRAELPLPAGAQVKVRGADARAVLERTPEGSVDLVIADIFAGARVPAHCATVEFATLAARVLAPGGSYAANITDGAGLAFARAEAATLLAVFPEVALIADPAVLRGKRFGNLILAAAQLPLPLAELGRRVATDSALGRLEHGAGLVAFTGGAAVLTDATAVPSPAPPPGTFAAAGGR
ncbi:spermidine synthase [Kitasatospora sp. NPDC058965]|uniref:spermidine synthase n=1 Tax=Kitasatospora sp. NPDC058965 TaxID=3346682 RepID=UPI0036CBBE00